MYYLTDEKIMIENEKRTVYGIRYDNEIYLSDVSANKEEVEHFVTLFNAQELAPYQLIDVVADMTDI